MTYTWRLKLTTAVISRIGREDFHHFSTTQPITLNIDCLSFLFHRGSRLTSWLKYDHSIENLKTSFRFNKNNLFTSKYHGSYWSLLKLFIEIWSLNQPFLNVIRRMGICCWNVEISSTVKVFRHFKNCY